MGQRCYALAQVDRYFQFYTEVIELLEIGLSVVNGAGIVDCKEIFTHILIDVFNQPS